MKLRYLLPALGFLTAPLSILTAAPQWDHEQSDIKVDPSMSFGKLANGMRYVIVPNQEPKGKVSVRLHIDAGSLMERDDQQGVAHFLEHMVFNGSRNFKPGELIPKMQKMGIAFGAHANAYTSFDETVYMLDLPNNQSDMLGLSFTIMRDYADGALLLPEEIDKERGIIIKELETRDSVQTRMMHETFKQLLPESLIPLRFPIGTREVIEKAPRERFTEFYQEYYVPERMTFVVVGDIKVDEIKKRIEETFGSMKQPVKVGAEPDLGKVSPEPYKVINVTDEEASSNDLELIYLKPKSKQSLDTSAYRHEQLKLNLAHGMLNRRLARLAKQENSVFRSASASKSDFMGVADIYSMSVSLTKPDLWQAGVAVADQELRKAIQFGFDESEFAEVKAEMLSYYENAVKSEPTRQNEQVAGAIISVINNGGVLSNAAEDLRVLKESFEAIKVSDCQDSLKQNWNLDQVVIGAVGGPQMKIPANELANALKESRKVEVQPNAKTETADFAYSQLGEPGKVVQKNEIADLGITQLVFANGLKVVLKPTDFKKNNISLIARFGNGSFSLKPEQLGLELYTTALYNAGGLEAHKSDEIDRIFAGKKVGVGLSISDTYMALQGSTTADDLEDQLKLMVAYLQHPGFHAEAEYQFDRSLDELYKELDHSPKGVMRRELEPWLVKMDPRRQFPTKDKLMGYTPEDAKNWLLPQLQTAPIELCIAGDFKLDEMVAALEKSFGALPKREGKFELSDTQRTFAMTDEKELKTFEYDSKIDLGISVTTWALKPTLTYQEVRRLRVLAEVLTDRLRNVIREELGDAYSPGASLSFDEHLIGNNHITAFSPGNSATSEKVAKLMIEIGEKIATEGIDEDEFDRAYKPLVGTLDQTLRENSYWLGSVMSFSFEKPERLDAAREILKDYNSIKREEIEQLAKEYFQRDNARVFAIRPKAAESSVKK